MRNVVSSIVGLLMTRAMWWLLGAGATLALLWICFALLACSSSDHRAEERERMERHMSCFRSVRMIQDIDDAKGDPDAPVSPEVVAAVYRCVEADKAYCVEYPAGCGGGTDGKG